MDNFGLAEILLTLAILLITFAILYLVDRARKPKRPSAQAPQTPSTEPDDKRQADI